MSAIEKQRVMLIGLFLTFVCVYPLFSNEPYPCETVRKSRAFTLDFNSINELRPRELFEEWAKVDATEETFHDYGAFVAWRANQIHYVAYYDGEEISHIELVTGNPDIQTILNCFGTPSASSNLAFAMDFGVYTQNTLWYDNLRVIVRAVNPTDVPAGTISPIDKSVEAGSIILYSPAAYEREKH